MLPSFDEDTILFDGLASDQKSWSDYYIGIMNTMKKWSWEDRVLCGPAEKYLLRLPDNYIPLTVTSPPYADLRKYKGHGFNFDPIAKELYRVTAEGGVLVWVIGDVVKPHPVTRCPSETGMPFKQVLAFMELGFSLHDTMAFEKDNPIPRPTQRRYTQQFEYMFVLTKGELKTWNPIKEPCKYAGVKSTGKYYENPDTVVPYRASSVKMEKGKVILDADGKPLQKLDEEGKPVEKRIAPEKIKGNLWNYFVGRDTHEDKVRGKKKKYHPATMKLQLAKDHILSWSNPGDLILDPMCGGGTTLLAAKELGRHYLGFDISAEYIENCKERLGL